MLNYDAEKSFFLRKNLEEGQKLKMNLSRFLFLLNGQNAKKEKRERENNKNGRKRERQCKQRNIFPSKRERENNKNGKRSKKELHKSGRERQCIE